MKPAPPEPQDGLRPFLRALEHKVRGKGHGTIIVVIEADEGVMTWHQVRETGQTFDDLRRAMVEMPRRGR